MNPLRSFFVTISRVPPALLLTGIVGLALVVTFTVNDTLTKQHDKYESESNRMASELNKKITVVYAVKDLPEGQTIPSDALEERSVEEKRVPQDALTSSSLVAGRVAKFGITASNIISQHDLAPLATPVGFEQKLRLGMRAVTFGVDNNTGVAGFVQPESRIDIIGMVGAGADTKTAPILSDVEVVAVGQTIQKSTSGTATPSSSVTVAVTPEDTQKLIKAISASKLYLALRNDKDHTPLATVDVSSLFGRRSNLQSTEISQMSLPLPSPPPIGTDLGIIEKSRDMANIAPPPKRTHEIEMWSGGRKDLVSLNAN